MTELLKYSFEMFEEDIKKLIDQIKQSDIKFNFITGPARGAFIPGVCLSHALGIEFFPFGGDIGNICGNINDDVLIIDDIIDTGETINEMLNSITNTTNKLGRLPKIEVPANIQIAALFYNPAQDLIKPDYWASIINRDVDQRWVEFWWEKMV